MSMAASSAAVKARLSRALSESSSWATEWAPISAEVTRGSRKTQAMNASRQVALELQRPLPDDAVKIVLRDAKEDSGVVAA